MKIGIAADHRGFRLKSSIIDFLKRKRYKVIDYGTNSDKAVDYPDFALRVAQAVARKKVKFGILSCLTGQGMVVVANKVKGIRAVLCTKPEIARLARLHNDANILVLPAGYMRSLDNVRKTIVAFLGTKFEGGRHQRRLKIIEEYENSK